MDRGNNVNWIHLVKVSGKLVLQRNIKMFEQFSHMNIWVFEKSENFSCQPKHIRLQMGAVLQHYTAAIFKLIGLHSLMRHTWWISLGTFFYFTKKFQDRLKIAIPRPAIFAVSDASSRQGKDIYEVQEFRMGRSRGRDRSPGRTFRLKIPSH